MSNEKRGENKEKEYVQEKKSINSSYASDGGIIVLNCIFTGWTIPLLQ